MQDSSPKDLVKSSIAKYNPTGHLIAVAGGDRCREIVIFSTLYHKQASGKRVAAGDQFHCHRPRA